MKSQQQHYTSVVMRALGFVTLTPSSFARWTISILFLDETACEILLIVRIFAYCLVGCVASDTGVDRRRGSYSAAKVLLCIRRRSTSRVLLTRKALWPEGIMWRVFLFDPNPIWSPSSAIVQTILQQRFLVARSPGIYLSPMTLKFPAHFHVPMA